MSSLRQVGLGIMAALFSTAIVFGSMLLALVEGATPLAMVPILMDTPQFDALETGKPATSPTATQPPDDTPSSICTDTPADWIDYQIMPGESLADIATAYGIPLETLRKGNCLSGDSLIAGSVLSVPLEMPKPTESPTHTSPSPTATRQKDRQPQKTTKLCSGPPKGWVEYQVKRGDNLFRIALSYNLTTAQLVAANCLDGTLIRVGQIIRVPWYTPQVSESAPTPRPTSVVLPPESTQPPPEPSDQSVPPAPSDNPVPPQPPEPSQPPQSPPATIEPSQTPPAPPVPTEDQMDSSQIYSILISSPEDSKLISPKSYL